MIEPGAALGWLLPGEPLLLAAPLAAMLACFPCAYIVCLPACTPTPPVLPPLLCARVERLFEDALRGCLEAKPLPFNCSLINDRMKRLDHRWNVQAALGELDCWSAFLIWHRLH